MECKFTVGERVVCAHPVSQKNFYGWETLPKLGETYTIRDIFIGSNGKVGVRLVEIVNRPGDYIDGTWECGFHHRNFKPLRLTEIDDLRQAVRDVFDKPKVTA